MKKMLWSIAIIIGAPSGILFYVWQQATATPDWYRDRASIRLNDDTAVQLARQRVADKIATVQPQPDRTYEIALNQQDVNAIAITEINHLAKRTQLTGAIESVNSTIQEGRIKSGAVINLANLPTQGLSSTEQDVVTWVRQTFPGMVDREIYVGVEGQPTIQDGQLQFDDSLRIKIGNLSLTVATLWQELNRELGALQIKDVQVQDDQLRLRGMM
jgi:hypothetical protein